LKETAITQHYWLQQTQTVQPPTAADKPRRERQKEIVKQELKREFTDRPTKVFSILVVIFLILCIASQIMITTGEITGPCYLSDFIR